MTQSQPEVKPATVKAAPVVKQPPKEETGSRTLPENTINRQGKRIRKTLR